MNQEMVRAFQNDKFGNIRLILIGGKEHFVANDVAISLGYSNPTDAILRHCVNIVKHDVENSRGQLRETNVINEGDVYRLITHSKLPNAEQFERWVFDEVLPSIRKNGTYMTDEMIEKVLTDPDLIIRLATQLKDERTARVKAEQQIEADKPKVIFADAVSVADTSILIGDLAKLLKQNGIDTGAKRLFEWLREKGYLIKRKGADYNSPTQYAMELGLFEVKETAVTHSDGHVTINKTTKVTGKGQQYFINKFFNDRK